MGKQNVEEVWESFWKEIVCNPDGSINIEHVKKELADFYFVMEQVPLVYEHVTGGLLSKVMYHANTVNSAADAHYEKLYQDEKEN